MLLVFDHECAVCFHFSYSRYGDNEMWESLMKKDVLQGYVYL